MLFQFQFFIDITWKFPIHTPPKLSRRSSIFDLNMKSSHKYKIDIEWYIILNAIICTKPFCNFRDGIPNWVNMWFKPHSYKYSTKLRWKQENICSIKIQWKFRRYTRSYQYRTKKCKILGQNFPKFSFRTEKCSKRKIYQLD